MALLACKGYVRPILVVLNKTPDGLAGSALSEQVASLTEIADAERKEAITDGTPKYIVRIKQARYWLKENDFVALVAGGLWKITELGKAFLQQGGTPVSLSRKGRVDAKKVVEKPSGHVVPQQEDELEEAPLEKIDKAIRQISDALETELLQRLSLTSPTFFERIVLELLRMMGYARDFGTVEHTGGAGDGGIDGILYLDRLGLERVYVQAKRWTKPVGAPEIQNFCGALSVNHAQKGVIMSTSTFTTGAQDCAKKAPQTIRLIDGKELAHLLIEFGVGVSRAKRIVIPELDRDFFEDS